MNTKLAGVVSIAAVCISSMCLAQDVSPKAVPFKFAAPLRTFNVAPCPLRQDTLDVNASMAAIGPVLQAIAAQAHLKVIVSDEVKNLLIPNVRLRQMTGHAAIQCLLTRCGLAWGKVGQDTYLVVPAPPQPGMPRPPKNPK